MGTDTTHTATGNYGDLDTAWDHLEAACLSAHIATATSDRWEGDTVRQATWTAMVDAAQDVAAIIGWNWHWAYLLVAQDMADVVEASAEIAVHPVTLLPVPADSLDADTLAAARTTAARPVVEQAPTLAPVIALRPAAATAPVPQPASKIQDGQRMFAAEHPYTGETVYTITYGETVTFAMFADIDGKHQRCGATDTPSEKTALKRAKKRYPIGTGYRVAPLVDVTDQAVVEADEDVAAAA